jgi:hypothetical protein
MDDARIWEFEESLWKADEAHYRASIDEAYVLVVPMEPYILDGQQAAERLAQTPDWETVTFENRHVSRPEEGLIVIGYHAQAMRGDEHYDAWCSSTYRRLAHEDWRVVQHQQTVKPVAAG